MGGCFHKKPVQDERKSRHEPRKDHKGFHDKYVVGKKLFVQNRGQVYDAIKLVEGETHVNLNSAERAVKVLDLKLANPQTHNKINHEIELWRTLKHENCVRLFDVIFGTNTGFCYMVMERCSSGILNLMERIDVDERSAGEIFHQALVGLDYLHQKRLVHGDIKPSSFVVGGGDSCTVKFCDFSKTQRLPAQNSSAKIQGECGTLPFMCPEMLCGHGYDEKADVWSFGVFVYVILFGRFPYGSKENLLTQEMRSAISSGHNQINFASSSQRSSSALAFVMRLLFRSPEERPSIVEALGLSYITSVQRKSHAYGEALPSLVPELRQARRLPAFNDTWRGTDDEGEATNIDDMLHQLQMQKHNIPLPDKIKDTRDKSSDTLGRVSTRSRDRATSLSKNRPSKLRQSLTKGNRISTSKTFTSTFSNSTAFSQAETETTELEADVTECNV